MLSILTSVLGSLQSKESMSDFLNYKNILEKDQLTYYRNGRRGAFYK